MRPVLHHALVILLGLALPFVGAGTVAGQAPGLDPEVVSLRFEGNDFMGRQELERAIFTNETACRSVLLYPLCWVGLDAAQQRYTVSPRMLQVDAVRLRVLYAQRGFRQATVDPVVRYPDQADSSQVELTFRIAENQPIRIDSLAFLGLDEVAGGILDGLRARVGGRLDGIDLAADRDSLLVRLQERGYAHAEIFREIFIPAEAPLTAEVTFDVYTGPRAVFGPVTFEVAASDSAEVATLSNETVRRAVRIRAGQPYVRSRVQNAQRDLYSLELVRFANIEEDLDHQPDSVIPLHVSVTEGDRRRVRTAIGMSTADCLNGEGRWTSRNFLGGARRVQLRARLSNVLAGQLNESACYLAGTGDFAGLNWQLAGDFTQPFVLGSRTSFQSSAFIERQSLQDVFIRNAIGATAALSRDIGSGQLVSLSFRPQVSRLEAAEFLFCTNFLVCNLEDIIVLQADNWLNPIGLTYTRSRIDQILDPTRGFTVLLDGEYAAAWTGSDFGYRRWQGEFAWYRTIAENVVFATRVRGGHVTPTGFRNLEARESGLAIIHPQKRFYAGGATSVRGFTENQLGPRVLTVDVQELVDPQRGPPVCTPGDVQVLDCDASGLLERPGGNFATRPTGGSLLAVGNAELRVRMGETALQAAVFLDVGQVWDESGRFSFGELEPTPGLGVRYFSPIGPIRLDVGYRLADAQRLPVVTSQIRRYDPDRDGSRPTFEVGGIEYVASDDLALLRPRVLFGAADRWALDRFQLHLSIGQAF
ncbi:MAG: BamA/TamA family outer membrane protein [Gemmatimonadota bacterium]|nr:BamA/TamA family outer membrane protein [Gemmatimonadota bacterium]